MKNKSYSLVLWTLFFVFCFRVFAQLIQSFIPNSVLPPFEAWHSGTLSYPVLVFFQIVIIFFYLSVCIRISGGTLQANNVIGKRLLTLGGAYAAIMIARYILRMMMFPAERWFGGSIPILFHVILASFLVTLGIYHYRNSEEVKSSKSAKMLWSSIYGMVFILTLAWLIYQLMPAFIAREVGLRPSVYSVSVEKNISITMLDGATLRADIYHPEKLSPAPTILVRVPLDDNFKGKIMSNFLGRIWAERGYNVMVQGVRGRFNSTGSHIPFKHERDDGVSTLRWLNQQSWHNGRTGMWGGSYFGYTQWAVADIDSLGLSALLTQISSSSNYKMFYPGGVFAYESALFWATRSYRERDTPLEYEKLRNGYDLAPLVEADRRTVGNDISFYDDWVSHDHFDQFWEFVDGIDRAKNLKVPTLMMAGWYDPFLSSQVQDFEDISQYADSAIAKKSRLIIGPWAHAETVPMPDGYMDRNYRLSSIGPSINWYDEHLKNVPVETSPRVSIFVMGINEWRDEVSFPLERTVYTPFYLSADTTNDNAGLLSTPPSYDSTRQPYIFDPANPTPSIGGSVLGARAGVKKQNELEDRNDVLVYTSDILKQNVEVTGKIKLILYVSTDARSTDFMAKLCDVHPDGSSFNISEGAIRKIYNGEGVPEKIEIELNPTSNLFLNGHCIRLLISSSSYPRFSLNYNTGNKNYDERNGVKAKQSIYTGTIFLSRLVLPIIPEVKH